jgi:hypothetical protein
MSSTIPIPKKRKRVRASYGIAGGVKSKLARDLDATWGSRTPPVLTKYLRRSPPHSRGLNVRLRMLFEDTKSAVRSARKGWLMASMVFTVFFFMLVALVLNSIVRQNRR